MLVPFAFQERFQRCAEHAIEACIVALVTFGDSDKIGDTYAESVYCRMKLLACCVKRLGRSQKELQPGVDIAGLRVVIRSAHI